MCFPSAHNIFPSPTNITEKIYHIVNDLKLMEEFGMESKNSSQDREPSSPPPVPYNSNKNGIWGIQDGSDIDKVALHGFTIADLIDLGAIAIGKEDNLLPNNLKGPIHPAFALDNWEKVVPGHFKRKKMFALGNDPDGRPRSGRYSAHNPVVWEALEPCLKLASKFVGNAHIFPWVRGRILQVRYETIGTVEN